MYRGVNSVYFVGAICGRSGEHVCPPAREKERRAAACLRALPQPGLFVSSFGSFVCERARAVKRAVYYAQDANVTKVTPNKIHDTHVSIQLDDQNYTFCIKSLLPLYIPSSPRDKFVWKSTQTHLRGLLELFDASFNGDTLFSIPSESLNERAVGIWAEKSKVAGGIWCLSLIII